MNRFSEARAWAQQAFPHQNAETVTERPWAITVRLLSVDQVAYLKIIPGKHRHCVQFTEAVADIGEGQTPRVIATDKSRGFLLLADHGGYDLDNYVSVAQRDEYLRGYAMLQGRAAASTKLTAILPSIALDNIVPQFLDFLNTESAKTDPSTTGAAYFLGRRAAKRYYEAFSAVQQQLEQFVGLAKALPQTLCHCDLRPQNIAIDTNGRYLFFDWDDASIGPVGFSLHTQFSGCCRAYIALNHTDDLAQNTNIKRDSRLLKAYMSGIEEAGLAEADLLHRNLASSICAGALHYLLSYSDYPDDSQSYQKTIRNILKRRLSDLLDLCQFLVSDDPKASKRLAEVFAETGRPHRASALYKQCQHPDNPPITSDFVSSDNATTNLDSASSNAFPTLGLNKDEIQTSHLRENGTELGANLFSKHCAGETSDVPKISIARAIAKTGIRS
ncbi:MAG: hypothetical protein ACI9XK_003098 [Granulosicoccus sp.]|jgi:hypothetical protein